MKLRYVVLSALAVLALAGCASPDATDSAGAPSSSAASDAASPSAPVNSRTVVASGSLSAVTVTGEIKDGVEAGCVLLSTADKTYLLLGGDRTKYRSGTTVTVTGVPQPDMASTCQQGTPFQVVSIKEG
ncbi:hypothetical protein ACFFX1_11435 [Dactylosporangium sucinum]|uniref:Lipoprotein n=1 Tax=Dactylosporangium sucinum TaxID=1424081 RepID=A0A917TMP9_9ACTN|nr:hypothetical protein [Dactylosporangium sucinum]GGM28318.1 hypothetical protein GCM10007977_032060 [Dactylosporangium sucinum]